MRLLNRAKSAISSSIGIALTAAAILLAGCSESEEKQSAPPGGSSFGRAVPVVTFPVEREALRDELKAVGTARALKSVTLFPESAGVVTAVNFEPDQRVEEGTLLLQLDSRDQELALELAKVQRDDAALAVRRYESMNLSEANIPESTLDTARATLASAEIAVRQAEVALERRRIVAPFTGRVGITDIDVGDRIDTATTVTTLDDRSLLLVDFPVPESFVGQVAPGTGVEVNIWERAGSQLTGEIIAVDSRIDPASRAFIARAGVDNAQDQLRPGMAFEIAVPVSRGEYLAVPDVSVQWGADGPYVWVSENAVAKRVGIKLVRRLTNKLMIEAELTEGAQVVAEGVQGVRDGLALRILDASALDSDARLELATPVNNGGDAGGAAGG